MQALKSAQSAAEKLLPECTTHDEPIAEATHPRTNTGTNAGGGSGDLLQNSCTVSLLLTMLKTFPGFTFGWEAMLLDIEQRC